MKLRVTFEADTDMITELKGKTLEEATAILFADAEAVGIGIDDGLKLVGVDLADKATMDHSTWFYGTCGCGDCKKEVPDEKAD